MPVQVTVMVTVTDCESAAASGPVTSPGPAAQQWQLSSAESEAHAGGLPGRAAAARNLPVALARRRAAVPQARTPGQAVIQ